jgi:hypothetical protein
MADILNSSTAWNMTSIVDTTTFATLFLQWILYAKLNTTIGDTLHPPRSEGTSKSLNSENTDQCTHNTWSYD